jgi:Domain of unknown function (DUF4188)
MHRNPGLTASIDGEFVVFLIGMRVNQPLRVDKWLPVVAAMTRMIGELREQPHLGLLHAEMWTARTSIMVQYWRSMEQLLEYAKNKSAQHLPAWRAFNKAVGDGGSVGIWHETYAVAPGTYEAFYGNMPPFGLGVAGRLEPAVGGKRSAAGRLGRAANAP